MLRGYIEQILNNYLRAKKENYSDHKLAKLIRTDLPKFLEEITENNDLYIFHGSAGQGNWAKCPWVAILNKKITNSVQSGYFPVYLFREDMKGVYLSFMFGTTEFRQKYGEKAKDELNSHASQFRAQYPQILETLNKIEIDLATDSPNSISSFYEAGSIAAKYYDAKDLPSEEELEFDYREIINFYIQITSNNTNKLVVIEKADEIRAAQEKFVDILYKTADEVISNVHWSNELGISIRSSDRKEFNRYLNGFGIHKPGSTSYGSVFCEINIPRAGINKTIGGAFAKDDEDNLYVIHRGLFGNLSKTNFKEKYTGKWTKIKDGKIESEFVVIGNLNDPNFTRNVRNFVYDVAEIKVKPKSNGKVTAPIDTDPEITFFEFLNTEGYLFDHKLVENFLLSLKVKPFVILTGNSGTGKTKLAQLFARYKSVPDESSIPNIQTEVKVGKSAKSGGWTLSKSEFYKSYPELKRIEHEYKIKVDGIQSNGNLYLWPQLFYDKSNNEIKTRLKKLAKEDPKQKVSLEISLPTSESDKFKIIPVGANWTENRHIIGFYNVITKEYQKTSSLDLILDARDDKSKPYFLILDEMNLSHVERYFSDFLSAMESGETMPLHDNSAIENDEAKSSDDDAEKEVPKDLRLPENLLVVGTVNVDETTYMFSPKVLDRANTIEFLTHNPYGYMQSELRTEEPSGDVGYLQDPLSDIEHREFSIDQLRDLMIDIKTNDNQLLWDILSLGLYNFYNELKKAGFDFGFRAVNEIMRFMYVAWKYEGRPEPWDNWERYFDAQIKQKMLPKLHGSQRTLQATLKSLFEICYGSEIEKDPRSISDESIQESAKYTTAALKLKEMDKILYEQRYTSFIT